MSNTPMSIGAKAMSQPNLVRGQSVEINLRAIADATKNSVIMIENFKHQDDWVSNSERSRCHICTKQFGAFRRKHHCRVCGEVVCSPCTLKKQVMLPMVGQTEARVCVTCVLAYCKPMQSGNGSFAVDGTIMSPAAYSLPSSGSSRDGRATTRSEFSRNNNTQLQSPDVMGGHGNYADPSTYFQSEPSPFDYALDFDWEHPWPKPPVPADESHRLDVLRSFDILGTPQEDVFDIICDLVSKSLNCPIAAVSFIDHERQWYKASVGLIQDEIPRNVSFCAHILYTKQSIVVPDTTLDKRFDRNPLVTGRAGIRFYAAAPIISPATGYVLGTVFVFDNHPRPRDQVDLATLEKLAGVAMKNLEDRRASVASSSAAFDHHHPVHRASNATDRASIVTSVAANDIHSPSPPPSTTGAPAYTPTAATSIQSDAPLPSPAATAITPPAAPVARTVVESLAPPSQAATVPSTAVVAGPDASTPTAVVTAEPPKMEAMLMNLLSQTTLTQQQLAKQQGSMYATISGHSTQIDKLAQAVARMEAKLVGGASVNGATTSSPDEAKQQQPGEKE